MFKPISQNKITQQIITQIRTAILEGELKPGDKLPLEKEMVELFQVSKQTLREALRALEHMGLIDVRKGIGGGSFIVEVDIEVAKESLTNFLYFKNLTLDNLSEFRKLIEPHAARKAAESTTSSELAQLKHFNELARTHLKHNDINAAKEAEIKFHQLIAEQTRNPMLILLLNFAESMTVDFKTIIGPDVDFFKQVLDAHERVFLAIRDRDPDRAETEMYDHIVQIEEGLKKLK